MRTVDKNIQIWRTHYRPILGILAAAQAPMRVEQLDTFVEIGKQDLIDFLMDLRQFLIQCSLDRSNTGYIINLLQTFYRRKESRRILD